jgi:hypothetical protein
MLGETRPTGLADRVERVRAALKTGKPSLLLASLLWRDLAEWAMDCSAPSSRSDEEQRLLREALAELGVQTAKWRLGIMKRRLDPFLRRQDASAPEGTGFVLTKKGDRHPRHSVGSRSWAAHRHWGMLPGPGNRHEITRAYLARHPFAESMRVFVDAPAQSGIVRFFPRGSAEIGPREPIDVFDVLRVPPGEHPVACNVAFARTTMHVDPHGRRAKVVVTTAHPSPLRVELPAGTEVSHADLLKLAYEQNRDRLEHPLSGTPLRLPELSVRLGEALQSGEKPSEVSKLRWKLLKAYLF